MNEQDARFHIGIFLPSLEGGGAERVTINLAQALRARGDRIDLILMRAEGPYLKDLTSKIRVFDLKQRSLKPLWKLLSIIALSRYLRAERPQFIVSALHSANSVALLAKLLTGSAVKIVVTEHMTFSMQMKNSPNITRKYMRKLMLVLMRLIYPKAEAVIGVSRGVVEDLVDIGLNPRNTRVIHNAVIDERLLRKSHEGLEHSCLREELPLILAVGRLMKQKDFPTLIQAFGLVRKQIPARLLILGEGKERQNLESLARELKVDKFVGMPGFVENPYKYMARASVFVLSSRWEALPTVLIEALACGAPVVSTDCHSGPREILQDGRYGALVPVGNVEKLAEAIIETVKRPGDRCMRIARSIDFSAEHIVNEYVSLLADAMAIN